MGLQAKSPDSLKPSPLPQDLQGLGHLAQKAYHHWKEFLPRMFRQLHREGKLREALQQAESLSQEALEKLVQDLEAKGYSPDQAERAAWEIVSPMRLLPPPEKDNRPSED